MISAAQYDDKIRQDNPERRHEEQQRDAKSVKEILNVGGRGQWISPHGIVYTTQDLAVETSYTIHKNDY